MSVLLAEKSGLLCNLFKENPNAGRLSFDHIPTPETFRLIARFCCGQEVIFTPENIIPILCLAFSLDMSQSPNSLYQQALQHLPYSPATNPGYPGQLVAGDMFPGDMSPGI
ncbi:phototropic-responsive NPH3 family protein, partial [Tanacetum coccineum]